MYRCVEPLRQPDKIVDDTCPTEPTTRYWVDMKRKCKQSANRQQRYTNHNEFKYHNEFPSQYRCL